MRVNSVEPLTPLIRSGLHPPRTLTFAITGSCNLACAHCWVGAGTPTSLPHVPTPVILRTIDEFAGLGGIGICFTGGEPLLHPDWPNLLRFARSRGFSSIRIQTNGMLFTCEALERLCELDFHGISIQISLDGATPASHDPVRGQGTFTSVLTGIRLLTEYGLGRRVKIFFTEMHHNLGEIPDLLKLAEELGVAAVTTGTLVRCGRAKGASPVRAPDQEQYRQLLDRFEIDTEFQSRYQRIGTTAALEWYRNTPSRTECCTFIENPYLTPNGRLYPCPLCHVNEFSVTDVFDKGLPAAFRDGAQLWRSLTEVSRSRSALPGCRGCPEHAACAGGCMGRACGSHGTMLSADDRCSIRQAIGRARGGT